MSIANRRALALRSIVGRIDDDTPALGVIDLDTIDEQIAALRTAFPESVLHTVAAKAVPLRPLLHHYAQAGMGCEAASRGELEAAVSAGFPSERIIFDSPAKTTSELRRAVQLGVSINIDNFSELERMSEILATAPATGERYLGVRINPQTGSGTIDAMSTATATSKFGIGLKDPGAADSLIEAFERLPWLNQLHVHSGSQGVSLVQAAEGIRAVVDLAERINQRIGHRQVVRIDIGGGLPVNFSSDEVVPTFADYVAILREKVPALFDFELLTEFGRAMAAKAGCIVSRVEYVKSMGGQPIALTHAGVQVATRTVFMPEAWPVRILAYSAAGEPKSGPSLSQDIAGPACFSGDVLARGAEIPQLDAGDLIVIPDTGAYYFSTPFSYNLLPRIGVFAFRVDDAGSVRWWMLRASQSLEELLNEAGLREMRSVTN